MKFNEINNDKTNDELFGPTSLRDRLHAQLNALDNKIMQEYDDLGFEALMNTKVYSKLFDKWDDGEHDPNDVIAYYEPVPVVMQAIAEMEDVSQNAYDYLDLEESNNSDSDLFADNTASRLARYFSEKAIAWKQLADEQRAIEDDEEYADGFENTAYALEEVANAFKLGMKAGLKEFRMLDTDPRENVAEEIEDALGIDIYALAYPAMNESDNNNKSDRDMFGNNKLASTIASRFEFPEGGNLGYTEGGGGIGYGGQRTNGLVIVNRSTNQVAFVPDFTYFDEEPTQETLEEWWYDDSPDYALDKLPLTLQTIQKILTLNESDDDLFSTRAAPPPKNLHLLKRWAISHPTAPKSRAFRIVAEFGIYRGLNLSQTLHILSEMDTKHGREEGIDEDEAEQLYRAYEMVYDAWVPNNPDDIDQSAAYYWNERPGQLDEIDDNMFSSRSTRFEGHDFPNGGRYGFKIHLGGYDGWSDLMIMDRFTQEVVTVPEWDLDADPKDITQAELTDLFFAVKSKNNNGLNEVADDDLFGQDNTIDRIHDAYGRIADYGNDGYEILDFLGGAYNQLSDKYDSGGDIDDIIARSNAVERKQLLLDLEYIADRCDEQYGNVNEADDDMFGSGVRQQMIAHMTDCINGWKKDSVTDPDGLDDIISWAEEIRNNMKIDFRTGMKQLINLSSSQGWADQIIEWAGERGIDMDTAYAIANRELEEAEMDIAEPPERPRKTKTKNTPDINLNPFQTQADQPLTNPNAPAGSNNNPVNMRRADQRTTLNKTASITPTGDMKNMLGRMRNVSIDPNLPGYPDQDPNTLPSVDVNTSNLPAVAGQALRAAGVQSPEFHQVANLPGNMAAQIRQLGRALFGSLTMTPTNRIYMIANLGGQGPNSTQEVSAVANFLKQHGQDRGPGEIDFDAIMPGYRAETRMFTASGIRWMLVKDFAGQYIYSWPEEDSADATPRLDEYEVDEGALDWAKKAAAATAIGAAGVGMFGTGQPNAPVQQPAQVAAPVAKPAQPTAQHIEHMQKSLSRPNAQLLITVARKHGLEGDELAQFLAQTAHESAGFGIAGMKEKPQPGKKNYFAKYKHNAGNKSVNDAKKFFGRGFVQLTGKYNYAEASEYLYKNHLVKTPDALLRNPDLAADPVLAAEIAVWFWKRFVQPNVNNFTDTASVTKKINPAMRGFDDRKNKFAALKQIMKK